MCSFLLLFFSVTLVPRQTPHEAVGDVLYAKVNKPPHSRIGALSKSQQNIDNARPDSASSVERRKSTPPRKPKRLPGSFGGSNVSLNDAGQRTVPRIVKNQRYLDVDDGENSERTQDSLDDEEDFNQEGEESDHPAQQQNGHRNQYQNGRQVQQNGHQQAQENRDFSPSSVQDDLRSDAQPQQDNILSANEQPNDEEDDDDIGSDFESDVPTPESSDIDDLFPDEDNNKGKPRINLRRAMASPLLSDVAPSAYESQNETGRESVMSTRSATDTDRGRATAGPKDTRGSASEFKPGDRFHVKLQKKGGSLGISVTVSLFILFFDLVL